MCSILHPFLSVRQKEISTMNDDVKLVRNGVHSTRRTQRTTRDLDSTPHVCDVGVDASDDSRHPRGDAP